MDSNVLFVMPSFLQGAGSVLDVAGVGETTNYVRSTTPIEADIRAMEADRRAVGSDLRAALDRVRQELPTKEGE